MSKELQIKVLKKLMKFNQDQDGKEIQEALHKKLQTIKKLLECSSEYAVLDDNMDYLSLICRQYPLETVSLLRDFLERLKTLQLVHKPVADPSDDDLERFYTKNTLKVKSLRILDNLYVSYSQLDDVVISLFLMNSLDPDRDVKEQACGGLYSLAYFNVRYWSRHKNFMPQSKIIELVKKLIKEKKEEAYWQLMVDLLDKVLSNQVFDDYSSDYNQVTFRRVTVPEGDERQAIREKCLNLLKKLYELLNGSSQEPFNRKALIIHHMSILDHLDDKADLEKALNLYGKIIVTFYHSLVEKEDHELLRRIEIQVCNAYQHIREGEESYAVEFKQAAADFRHELNRDGEFVIYKTLWGHDSVFEGNWTNRVWYSEADRDPKVESYLSTISDESFEQWEGRITGYLAKDVTRLPSHDMNFVNFLQLLSEAKPEKTLMSMTKGKLQILKNESRYAGFVMRELLKGEYQEQALSLINSWIDDEELYKLCTSVFNLKTNIHPLPILQKTATLAIKKNDGQYLMTILHSIVAHYEEQHKSEYKSLFFEIIEALHHLKNNHWMHRILYQDHFLTLISQANEKECSILLKNFLSVLDVSSDIQEILACLAEKYLNQTLIFFKDRWNIYYKEKRSEKETQYDPSPTCFFKLDKVYEKHPKEVLDFLYDWFVEYQRNDSNFLSFSYVGGRFFNDLFKTLPEAFKKAMYEQIHAGKSESIHLILSLLENHLQENDEKHDEEYRVIEKICQKIIEVLPEDSYLLNSVRSTLIPKGWFVGEFAEAEAYEKVAETLKTWMQNSNEKISNFAHNYFPWIEKKAHSLRQEAEDDLAVRKYQYTEG